MTAPQPASPAPRISSPAIASSESLNPTLNDAQIERIATGWRPWRLTAESIPAPWEKSRAISRC